MEFGSFTPFRCSLESGDVSKLRGMYGLPFAALEYFSG
jgi:hypothetical protein